MTWGCLVEDGPVSVASFELGCGLVAGRDSLVIGFSVVRIDVTAVELIILSVVNG